MAVTDFARDLNSVRQDGTRLFGSSALRQRLAFLKVRGNVLGVLVDHRLKQREAGFHVSLRDPGLGERVLQKHVVWIGLEQLFELLGRWQLLSPEKDFPRGRSGQVLRRTA